MAVAVIAAVELETNSVDGIQLAGREKGLVAPSDPCPRFLFFVMREANEYLTLCLRPLASIQYATPSTSNNIVRLN
jgi:hypothetical protein